MNKNIFISGLSLTMLVWLWFGCVVNAANTSSNNLEIAIENDSMFGDYIFFDMVFPA